MLIFPRLLPVFPSDAYAASFLRAKYAGGNGMIKALRVADCYKPFTHLCTVGIAHRNRWKVVVSLDLQDGQVKLIARAKHLGFIWLFNILQRYLNDISIVHNVLIS
ncbi:hypothetical protein D3C77_447380 [compost metagenome]